MGLTVETIEVAEQKNERNSGKNKKIKEIKKEKETQGVGTQVDTHQQNLDALKKERKEIMRKLNKFFNSSEHIKEYRFIAYEMNASGVVGVRQYHRSLVARFRSKRSFTIWSRTLRNLLKNDEKLGKYFVFEE